MRPQATSVYKPSATSACGLKLSVATAVIPPAASLQLSGNSRETRKAASCTFCLNSRLGASAGTSVHRQTPGVPAEGGGGGVSEHLCVVVIKVVAGVSAHTDA